MLAQCTKVTLNLLLQCMSYFSPTKNFSSSWPNLTFIIHNMILIDHLRHSAAFYLLQNVKSSLINLTVPFGTGDFHFLRHFCLISFKTWKTKNKIRGGKRGWGGGVTGETNKLNIFGLVQYLKYILSSGASALYYYEWLVPDNI